jgi:DNA topoisomerase-1
MKEDSDSSSEDDSSGSDVPLSQRKRAKASPAPKRKASSSNLSNGAPKRQRATRAASSGRNSDRGGGGGKSGGEKKWDTLVHHGVLFPPEYEPHGVKMLYDGKPVTLTPEQEEVASMYAVMLETDYMSKDMFKKNFWEGFKEVLGPGHVIKGLDKCNFKPIYDHLQAERERKKNLTKEVRQGVCVCVGGAQAWKAG